MTREPLPQPRQPFGLLRQAEAQEVRRLLEAAAPDMRGGEPPVQGGGIGMADEPEKRRAAEERGAALVQNPVERGGLGGEPAPRRRLPAAIGEGGRPYGESRAGHGPIPERGAQAVRDGGRRDGEAEAKAGEPVELAEGAQHDHRQPGHESGSADGAVEIGESLVHDQPAAGPRAILRPAPDRLGTEDAPVRVVGIDDDAVDDGGGNPGLHVPNDLAAGRAPARGMLGIGRPEDGDGAGRSEAGQPLDQRLGSGRGHDPGGVGNRVGVSRGREQGAHFGLAGQPLPAGPAQGVRHGPGMGIDPGREIEPFRPARAVARLGLRQVAAMSHGLRIARPADAGKGRRVRARALAALVIGLAALHGPAWAAPHVVSINLCADQLLVPLADADQILGLSPYARDRLRSGVAAEAERFPSLSGTAEEVLALKPDFVLSGRFTKRATRELLRQHGVRLVELDAARSIDEAKAQIRQVGELLGHPERAESAVARIDEAASRVGAAAPSGLTVLPLQRRGWVAGGDTLLGSMLRLVGLTPALGGRSLGRFLTLEEIVARRPDLLAVSEAGGAEDQGAALLLHPALLRLYPPGRRIVLPDSLNLLCGGPSLAGALDRLAAEIGRAAKGR